MSNTVDSLEKKLELAKAKLDSAIRNAQKSFGDKERNEWSVAHSELLQAERNLAKDRNEEYAEPLEFPVEWDTGAPLPFVLQNEGKTILTFYIRDPDPDWDGTYVNVVDTSSEDESLLALVEFKWCSSSKFGSPNDEVHEGHPLFGRGLDSYTAQIVRNSRWIEELKSINSVHNCFNPDNWKRLNHYIFWFHDTTFECIADSFTVETFKTNMGELLKIANERLLEKIVI